MTLTPGTPRLDAAAERSELVGRALKTAQRAHAGQVRRGSNGRPFIDHPVAVAECLAGQRHRDEVLAAGLLHDTVEKSAIEIGDIRADFGDTVGDLVAAMTEDEAIPVYEERKDEHRRRVAECGEPALAIFAADKLANVAMLREAYLLLGEAVGDELVVPLDLKVFIWEEDLEMLFSEAPEMALTNQFADELVKLWGDRFKSVSSQSG